MHSQQFQVSCSTVVALDQIMAAVNSAKVKEGDKLVAEAEKSLKTNWLKWNPDFDSASHSFEKAALCYRIAKAFEKARDTYERAADAYYKNHATFHSGKSLEQAANICRDMKNFELAADFLVRASGRYHESGQGDTAGQVLTKAAKLVELVNPHKAAEYYLSTADLHEIEEKYRDAAKAVRAAVNMYAKARNFDKLLETIQRAKQLCEQSNLHKHLYELAAIEVAAHLHNDDTVAALETYNEACGIGGFAGSDEAPLLERMIEAYRERNEEEFQQCCDDITFRTMDNEIAKMARDLKTKLGFCGFDSPTHTSSRATSIAGTSTTRSEPRATTSKDTSLSRMKDELFGGSGTSKTRVESSPPPEQTSYEAEPTNVSELENPSQGPLTSVAGGDDEDSEEEDRSDIL